MASITGKDGYVTKQVSGADTLIVGIREWTIDYSSDLIDVTAFAEAGVTHKSKVAALSASGGSFVGIIQSTDVDVDCATEYNLLLNADTNRAYYGAAFIQQVGTTVNVSGEALATYTFEFTGKVYVLGVTVVVDGTFIAGTSAAWDVSDANISYDTTNDQIDWNGDGDLVPASNDVIVDATAYWTQMLLENETGTTSCTLKLGTASGTARTANGTYTEIITSNSTTFTISVTTDTTLSLSSIQIRTVLN